MPREKLAEEFNKYREVTRRKRNIRNVVKHQRKICVYNNHIKRKRTFKRVVQCHSLVTSLNYMYMYSTCITWQHALTEHYLVAKMTGKGSLVYRQMMRVNTM